MLSKLVAPLHYYNDLLIRFPLMTKSVTSGVMYGSGDVLAQYAETYNTNRIAKEKHQHLIESGQIPANTEFVEECTTVLDKRRIAIFFIFGTVIGGPAYHYWFNYLNELPALLWRMKQTQHRGKILRSYAYLRSHGIEVKLDLSKLPNASPLTKWKGKAAKIAADQLIFSSIYTLVFFMTIGLLDNSSKQFIQKQLSAENDKNNIQNLDYSSYLTHHAISIDEVITAEEKSMILDIIRKVQIEKKSLASSQGSESGNSSTLSPAKITQKLAVGLSKNVHLGSNGVVGGIKRFAGDGDTNPEEEFVNEDEEEEQTNHIITEILRVIHLSKYRKNIQNGQTGTNDNQSSTGSSSVVNTAATNDANNTSLQPVSASWYNTIDWKDAYEKSWQHTKDVYVETYLADCVVWPPLQLINFTFIPLRFQFLFVNVANLAWNTFLSFMANKKH